MAPSQLLCGQVARSPNLRHKFASMTSSTVELLSIAFWATPSEMRSMRICIDAIGCASCLNLVAAKSGTFSTDPVVVTCDQMKPEHEATNQESNAMG